VVLAGEEGLCIKLELKKWGRFSQVVVIHRYCGIIVPGCQLRGRFVTIHPL
jgi:hypothetical protein